MDLCKHKLTSCSSLRTHLARSRRKTSCSGRRRTTWRRWRWTRPRSWTAGHRTCC